MRTRIAPSPTGFMHVGTLRTMLWDYFMARQSGGQFIVRIEDTDQEREVEGALEGFLQTLKNVGLDHDEGPVLNDDGTLGEKGGYGPYIQTQRLDIYKTYADKLLANGDAYYCFCSSEELDEMRKERMALKQNPKYDRRCLRLSKEEIEQRLANGDRPTIRMKMPEGRVEFDDAIRGRISFDLADSDDQVLTKSNGIPTYHLAVVIDDELMKITHVLRGEEWLPSMPKQIILAKMLGFTLPTYCHVPLLLNPDKTKLSKRKGDVSVESYLAKGYLPETLFNFLGLLGFNPTGDRETYSPQEMIDLFDITRVNKSGAVMNLEKLDWMNRHYLKEMGEGELLEYAQRFVASDLLDPAVKRAVFVERLRIDRLDQLQAAIEQYFTTQSVVKEALVWKKGTPEDALLQLRNLKPVIEALSNDVLSAPGLIEEAVKRYITDSTLQTGAVLWPLRVALSQKEQSASPFEYLYVLQKDEALKRIDAAIAALES